MSAEKKEILHHPLRIKNNDIKNDAFTPNQTKTKAPEHLIILVQQLNELMNSHLPQIPELEDTKLLLQAGLLKTLSKFVWKPFFNKQNKWGLYAEIPFEYPEIMPKTIQPLLEQINTVNAILKESFAQYFTEAFQQFGARYGISVKSWVIYLPLTHQLNFSIFETEFKQQLELQWTRLSNYYGKFSCVSILPMNEHSDRSEKPQKADVINKKFNFFKRVHIHPTNTKVKVPLVHETTNSLSHSPTPMIYLKQHALFIFLQNAKIPHTFYSQIESDPSCHLAIHAYAKNCASNTHFVGEVDNEWKDIDFSDSSNILVIALYPEELALIDQKLHEAAERSIQKEKLYIVTGTVKNPEITLFEEEIESGLDFTKKTEAEPLPPNL